MVSVKMLNIWLIFVTLINISPIVSFTGLLDIDEIKSYAYGVDILEEPLLYNEETLSNDGITVFSKLGQLYQCLYSIPIGDIEDSALEADNVHLRTNASLLLDPMKRKPCLNRTFGWWAYEYCHGQYLKQYHMDDSGNIEESSQSFLGHYASDFDWKNANVEKADEYQNQYHSQFYANGSICDITGKPRITTIRFKCSPVHKQEDLIVSLAEPSTCEYILTISTTKICKLQYLKSLPSRRLTPIKCSPLLKEHEFDKYLEYKKKKEEELKTKKDDASITLEDTLAGLQKLLTRSRSSSLIVVGVANDDNVDNIIDSMQDVLGASDEQKTSENVEVITSIVELTNLLKSFEDKAAAGSSDVPPPEGPISDGPMLEIVDIAESDSDVANDEPASILEIQSENEQSSSSDIDQNKDKILPDKDPNENSNNKISPDAVNDIGVSDVSRNDEVVNDDDSSNEIEDGKRKDDHTVKSDEAQDHKDLSSEKSVINDDIVTDGKQRSAKVSWIKHTKVFEFRPDSDEMEPEGDEPMRQLEIKILNADYYDKDGKPVSSEPGKKVMAVFQQNDGEIEEYERQQKLEANYNFRWRDKQ